MVSQILVSARCSRFHFTFKPAVETLAKGKIERKNVPETSKYEVPNVSALSSVFS